MPIVAVLFWLHVAGIVAAFARQPDPKMAPSVCFAVSLVCLFGLAASAFRYWADFVRGDYYLNLAKSQGW